MCSLSSSYRRVPFLGNAYEYSREDGWRPPGSTVRIREEHRWVFQDSWVFGWAYEWAYAEYYPRTRWHRKLPSMAALEVGRTRCHA